MHSKDRNEQQILDEALQHSDRLLQRSLQIDERRSRRIWYCSIAIAGVVGLALIITFMPTNYADLLVEAEYESLNENATIDLSQCGSVEWQNTIDKHLKFYERVALHRPMTLFRVLLKGSPPGETKIQLRSTKLNSVGQSGGGGIYRVVTHGEFVVLEHFVNNNQPQQKAPLEIGNKNYHRAEFQIAPPEQGKLAILGDVVLTPCKVSEMGAISIQIQDEADTAIKAKTFLIGPVVVGGVYGEEYSFEENLACKTKSLAPGTYKTFLPDFDKKKSRWDIDVIPGKTTVVQFLAKSQQEIQQVSVTTSASN